MTAQKFDQLNNELRQIIAADPYDSGARKVEVCRELRDAKCKQRMLGPDGIVRECVLVGGHEGLTHTGRR